MNNYTVIHLHSDLSSCTTNIDSVTNYKEYIDKAKELGMKAIAFTEHGNIFRHEKKRKYCKENGIKYIHGVEAYITETLNEKIKDNYHICLYAKNFDGYMELNRLMSHEIAYNRKDNHFYYVPRISIEELENTSDNIIVSTACLGGILNKGNEYIKQRFINFLIKNKTRCFLEIQHHLVRDQVLYNKYLYDLSKKYNIKLIVGTDTHALDEKHLLGRKILQEAKGIFFNDETDWDLSFKTYDELIDIYKKQNSLDIDIVKQALGNTNVLADMIDEYEIDKTPKYPKLYDNPEKIFKNKINKGVIKRGINKLPNYKTEYLPRIHEEFDVYKKCDSIEYMLLQDKILSDARKNGVQCGYGRGSVNGSLIAYLLEITDMDSIKHGLHFFRFMNPSRISLCDIDIDYSEQDREWIKKYLFNMKGIYTSEIITFNTVALKGAIREVGRFLRKTDHEKYSLDNIDKITKNIENDEQNLRSKYQKLFEYVDLINGTIVSVGTHASGVVVSPVKLSTNMGTCTLKDCENPVSVMDMKEIDSLNWIKLDCLGLDTIGIINDTCKLVGIERPTPDNVKIEDEVMMDIIKDTTNIFQFESDFTKSLLQTITSDESMRKIKEKYNDYSYFDAFQFVQALCRPGGASIRDKAIKGICNESGIKELDNMLSDTLGYVLLQEQIMKFLTDYCGYSGAESDSVRRMIAKKGGTESAIPEIKRRFKEYSIPKYNLTEEKADEIIEPIIDTILNASLYSFSKNHNKPYAYTGYIAGYLRYHYPIEFITSSLNCWTDKNKQDKINETTKLLLSKNIKLSDIKFRYSRAKYSYDLDSKIIYKGLKSIKFLNEQVAEELYGLKDFKGDFVDLLKVITEDTSCNSRQLKILISLDYFKEFGFSKYLLSVYELFSKRYKKTLKDSTKVKRIEEIKETIKEYENEDLSIQEKISAELEFLGYCTLQDDNFKSTIGAIIDISDKFSTRWMSIYFLKTGETQKFKIKYSMIQESELKVGDIVNVKEIKERAKSILVDGQWSADMSQMERHITNIKKVRI